MRLEGRSIEVLEERRPWRQPFPVVSCPPIQCLKYMLPCQAGGAWHRGAGGAAGEQGVPRVPRLRPLPQWCAWVHAEYLLSCGRTPKTHMRTPKNIEWSPFNLRNVVLGNPFQLALRHCRYGLFPHLARRHRRRAALLITGCSLPSSRQ